MAFSRMSAARERRGAMMSSWPSGWGWNDPAAIPPPGLFNSQRAGVPVTPHTVLQVGIVHRCVEVITNAIIQMGNPQAYRTNLDKDSRPFRVYIANQPNILTNTFGNVSQTEGVTQTLTSMALFGEAFWFTLTRDFYGFPAQLEVLNPLFVTVNVDPNTMAPLYYYGTGLNKKALPTEDVTHIKGLTMPGARRALSAIEYEGPAFAIALAALDYGSRWFAQGASPSFLLTTDQRVGKDEIQRIAEKFLVEHSGLQSAHLPLVVDSGMKVEKLGATPDEAEFIGTLDYIRQDIAGYFGLPPHLVGNQVGGDNWGKGLEEMNFAFIDYTLSGYIMRLNEAYTGLLPRGQYASLDETTLARANAADRAREVQTLRTATVMTPNEIRRDYYSLPPLDGGDAIDSPLASNVATGSTSASGVEAGTNTTEASAPASATGDDTSAQATDDPSQAAS